MVYIKYPSTSPYQPPPMPLTKVDYSTFDMSLFVSKASLDIICPGRSTPPGFREDVYRLVRGVRLPSSTIFLGLLYLFRWVTIIRKQVKAAEDSESLFSGRLPWPKESIWNPREEPCAITEKPSLETPPFRLLTIALYLAHKFWDDCPLRADAWVIHSSVPAVELHRLEMNWLVDVGYRLYRKGKKDIAVQEDAERYREKWNVFQAKEASRAVFDF